MSAILCRNGDIICDLCYYSQDTTVDNDFECPVKGNPIVKDETAVGNIVVCEKFATENMIKSNK